MLLVKLLVLLVQVIALSVVLLYHAARAILVGGLLCLGVRAGLSGQVVGDVGGIGIVAHHLLMAGLFAGGAGGQTGRIALVAIVGLLVLLGVKVSGQLRLVLLGGALLPAMVVSGRAMRRA